MLFLPGLLFLPETLPASARVPFSLSRANPFSFIWTYSHSSLMFKILLMDVLAALPDPKLTGSYQSMFEMRQFGWVRPCSCSPLCLFSGPFLRLCSGPAGPACLCKWLTC